MITIKLKDKKNGCISNEVSLDDLIYRQHDIEFRFPDYKEEGIEPYEASLPYSDFLFFCDEYEVIVKVSTKEEEDNDK